MTRLAYTLRMNDCTLLMRDGKLLVGGESEIIKEAIENYPQAVELLGLDEKQNILTSEKIARNKEPFWIPV